MILERRGGGEDEHALCHLPGGIVLGVTEYNLRCPQVVCISEDTGGATQENGILRTRLWGSVVSILALDCSLTSGPG
jgi:hypothetical protein